MNVKYQIFVSSTYEDLKDERAEVIKACLNMGHIPVGMEMFNAADEEQWAVITRTIDQCDYYVVIVAHRYGSTTPEGISFTEKEYDYAVSKGVPVLGFIIDDGVQWPANLIDKDPASVEALERFKAKVKGKIIRCWSDSSQLQAHFAMSLATTIGVQPRGGWIRAPEASCIDVVRTSPRERPLTGRIRADYSEADHVESVIKMLKQRQFNKQLNGADVFMSLAYAITTFRFSPEWLFAVCDGSGIHVDAAEDFLGLLNALRTFEVSLTGDGCCQLTELGSKVYIRLSLEREAESRHQS